MALQIQLNTGFFYMEYKFCILKAQNRWNFFNQRNQRCDLFLFLHIALER